METSASFEARSAPSSYPTEPHRPRAVRGYPRGCKRSVGRGMRKPAIEPRKTYNSGADAVPQAEGNTYGHDSASVHMARRGRRTWHVQTLLVSGNRESSRSTARSMAAGPRRGGEEP